MLGTESGRLRMLGRGQFSLLVGLATLTFALAVANAVLFTLNRDVQTQVNARQQYLQQTVGLEGLYRDIVKALAEMAMKNNDTQLLQMLASQGVNVSIAPAPSAAAPTSAPAGPGRR